MWPFRKSLEDLLFKKIVVHGVPFKIKRLDPSSFLDGSKVMLQAFDIYKVKKDEAGASLTLDKVKEHYRDVFMSSIVEPKLKRKEDGEGLFVDHLFTEWDLATKLYERIIEYTYGKKNLKLSLSRAHAHQI